VVFTSKATNGNWALLISNVLRFEDDGCTAEGAGMKGLRQIHQKVANLT
jgi:hypothetical protein